MLFTGKDYCMLAKHLKLLIKFSVVLLFGSALLGCTNNYYRQDADQESYEAIAEKTDLVPGMSANIGIDEERIVDLSGFPTNEDSFEFLDNEAASEVGAHILRHWIWHFNTVRNTRRRKNSCTLRRYPSLSIATAMCPYFQQEVAQTINGMPKTSSLRTCRP